MLEIETNTLFYQDHLNRVSRSFAFCIEQLEQPLRDWVSLSYLLCRILDTVEDTPWDVESEQQGLFSELRTFIQEPSESDRIANWVQRFEKVALPDGERALIQQTQVILKDLHSPQFAQVRSILQDLSLEMCTGMEQFATRKNRGQLRLKNLTEINRYCFYVAGLVGEALAKFLEKVESAFHVDAQRIREAHHFGLFLQKVNLLKDQSSDEKQGRFLVGNRQLLWQSMTVDLQGAFRFLAAVPVRQRRFRIFCAWSLFLGLGTLSLMRDPQFSLEGLKLSRLETESILQSVSAYIDDPRELEQLFIAMSEQVGLEMSNWDQRSLSAQLNS